VPGLEKAKKAAIVNGGAHIWAMVVEFSVQTFEAPTPNLAKQTSIPQIPVKFRRLKSSAFRFE